MDCWRRRGCACAAPVCGRDRCFQLRSRKSGIVIDCEKPLLVLAPPRSVADKQPPVKGPAAPADAAPKMFGNADKLSRARQVDQLLMGTFEGGKGEAAPEEENKHL
jgi:hypothetical protein